MVATMGAMVRMGMFGRGTVVVETAAVAFEGMVISHFCLITI